MKSSFSVRHTHWPASSSTDGLLAILASSLRSQGRLLLHDLHSQCWGLSGLPTGRGTVGGAERDIAQTGIASDNVKGQILLDDETVSFRYSQVELYLLSAC